MSYILRPVFNLLNTYPFWPRSKPQGYSTKGPDDFNGVTVQGLHLVAVLALLSYRGLQTRNRFIVVLRHLIVSQGNRGTWDRAETNCESQLFPHRPQGCAKEMNEQASSMDRDLRTPWAQISKDCAGVRTKPIQQLTHLDAALPVLQGWVTSERGVSLYRVRAAGIRSSLSNVP